MGTYTPLLKLYKPSSGEDGWLTKFNENFDIIDKSFPVYVGTINDFNKCLNEHKNVHIILTGDLEFIDTVNPSNALTIAVRYNTYIDMNGHSFKNISLVTMPDIAFSVKNGIFHNSRCRIYSNTVYLKDCSFIDNGCIVIHSDANVHMYVDGCYFENSNYGIKFGENIHGTSIIHNCYFINCRNSIYADENAEDLNIRITGCNITNGTCGIVVYGKTCNVENTTVSNCLERGIHLNSLYDDAVFTITNSTIQNIKCDGQLYGGLELNRNSHTIKNTLVKLNGVRITGCCRSGINNSTNEVTLLFSNTNNIENNYRRYEPSVYIRSDVDAKSGFSLKFEGTLTEKILLATEPVPGGLIGTCDENIKGENNILCNGTSLHAVRDGTTLRWSSL